MSAAIRVLLADDHTLVRAGLRKILEAHDDVKVIGEVASGEDALQSVAANAPDVVVLDLTLPGIDGFEVLRRLKSAHSGVKVLVLTMHADADHATRAVELGAEGYLVKDSAAQDLVAGLRAVVAGHAFYSPAVQQALTARMRGGATRPLDLLTEREREVLKLVAQGFPTKEIAARLEISARTVETHRANLMRKLDVRSVALLTQFAIREGLVPDVRGAGRQ